MAFTDVKITQRLSDGETLIADGAAGTTLIAAGIPAGTPPEQWNVERPEVILALHRSYVEAGSQIILTNTFGGSRLKLEKFSQDEKVREFNLAGVKLARQAAGDQAYVAGDLGPTGILMKPMGTLTFEQAVETFAEQAAILVEAGVDLLWVETMMDLEEAHAAVTGAQQASDLPVFCSMSFGKKGRTMMGVSGKQAAEVLWPMGLAAIGANCGEGLEPVEIALQQMRAALPDAPLIAKPNAGLPHMVGGQAVYDVGPLEFTPHMVDLVALGAQVVGACCGSNPDYISAIRSAVKEN